MFTDFFRITGRYPVYQADYDNTPGRPVISIVHLSLSTHGHTTWCALTS